jgi:anti-sigma regulatory factor (Ser/Thr protein kinase)
MAATTDDLDGCATADTGADALPGVRTQARSWQRSSFLELAALPTAVPCGRLHTRHVLWEWNLAHLSEDAQVLVSELLTNAVKATSSACSAGLVALRLLASSDRFVIEVWDHAPGDPQRGQLGASSETGRGFTVIEALSSRWGCRRFCPTLKVVWCQLQIHATKVAESAD